MANHPHPIPGTVSRSIRRSEDGFSPAWLRQDDTTTRSGMHNLQVTGQGVGRCVPPQYWLIGTAYKVCLFFFF